MNEKDAQIIEQFLSGKLNDAEVKEFNSRLKEDVNFAKEFNLYKEVNDTLSKRFSDKNRENELKETLISLGEKQVKANKNSSDLKPKVFFLQRYSKFLVAASLVIFATLLWFTNSKPNFSDYATYPDLELTTRGGNVNNHIKNAENSFNNKDYQTAQKELEILLKTDRTKVELQLYLAIFLMEQNHFNKADKILKKILNGNSVYKDKAIWYLALSKLKQERYKKCKEYLKKIPKDASEYANAQDLLSKL